MANYRKKHGRIELVWLDREFTYVVGWKKQWNGNQTPVLATIPPGDALVFEGEGADQTIYHLPRAEALARFEMEEEVIHYTYQQDRRPAAAPPLPRDPYPWPTDGARLLPNAAGEDLTRPTGERVEV